MGIGVSVFLLAIGAILTFAIGADTIDIVNINVVGIILMIAGAIGLLLTMLVFGRDRGPTDTVVTRERDVY